jgi:RNA polymerase sigma-70 factor, ECF subfamily
MLSGIGGEARGELGEDLSASAMSADVRTCVESTCVMQGWEDSCDHSAAVVRGRAVMGLMQQTSATSAGAASAVGATDGVAACAQEFLPLFEASRHQMWLIAAGVTGDRTEADDVLQEAAMIAMRKFGTFERGTNFNAWMAEVTRNTARNARRKRGRIDRLHAAASVDARGGMRDDGREEGEVHGAHGGDAACEVRTDVLLEAVKSLEEMARTCLLLRVVGGLSYEAIALVTRLPQGTAMSHVFRAREKLRERLSVVQGREAADANRTRAGRSQTR